MAGTINFAMTQQFDAQGRPLSGGLLYFFASGTSTPQTPFVDVALTLAHPNPIVLDSSGRVPMFYLADGTIKIRLTDKNGVTIMAADQLLVIGPSGTTTSSGSGVSPDAVLATGDIKARYGTGTLTGFVRCNGNSIGNSGGTEAFGSQCQTLFEYLWQFSNITLNVSKGASANADWLANRLLNLPDLRGRTIAGMDDMGASAAGRLTAAGLGVAGTTVGNAGAAETAALAIANLPDHVHIGTTAADGLHVHTGGTTGIQSADHDHGVTILPESAHTHPGTTDGQNADHTHSEHSTSGVTPTGPGGGGSRTNDTIVQTGGTSNDHTHTFTTGAGSAHNHGVVVGVQSASHTHAFNVPNTGSAHGHAFATSATTGATATAFSKVQATMVLTFYIKL
jgi:formylmethanofuran dehydrogenase subunit C